MGRNFFILVLMVGTGITVGDTPAATPADSQPETASTTALSGPRDFWAVAISKGEKLLDEAWTIWRAGGWCMPGIAAVAVLMFCLGVHVKLNLRDKGFRSVPEKLWRRWISHPGERRGPVGELLDFVSDAASLKDSAVLFDELRATELAPFERDLWVMKVCVGAAPLLGLLGTVTGMLVTFNALAQGGGEKTMALIAAGISEALITTEAGLVVALPGLFFHYHLLRAHDRYRSFLAHMETLCTQELYWKLRARQKGVAGQAA